MSQVTAEPGRKRAYNADLRWQIMYQRIGRNLTFANIARNLCISTATAQRIYSPFERTGNVERVFQQNQRVCKISGRDEVYTVGMVLHNPSFYLTEICQSIKTTLGIEVSPSTLCRLLRRYKITRKKIRQVALQRCDSLRGSFMSRCFLMP